MQDIMDMQALKSLISPIDFPAESLGVGEDERHEHIPFEMLEGIHIPTPVPIIPAASMRSFEEVQPKFAGAELEQDDFSSEEFYIGEIYDSAI